MQTRPCSRLCRPPAAARSSVTYNHAHGWAARVRIARSAAGLARRSVIISSPYARQPYLAFTGASRARQPYLDFTGASRAGWQAGLRLAAAPQPQRPPLRSDRATRALRRPRPPPTLARRSPLAPARAPRLPRRRRAACAAAGRPPMLLLRAAPLAPLAPLAPRCAALRRAAPRPPGAARGRHNLEARPRLAPPAGCAALRPGQLPLAAAEAPETPPACRKSRALCRHSSRQQQQAGAAAPPAPPAPPPQPQAQHQASLSRCPS
jgi:hypothetical protein